MTPQVGPTMPHRRRWLCPARRSVVLAVVLAGAGAVVLAAGRPWAGQAVSAVPGVSTVTVTGTQAAPATTAVALVTAAGAVTLAVAGRVARRVVAGLLALAGLGLIGPVVAVLRDPAWAVSPSAVAATGQTAGSAEGTAQVTAWPWLGLLGGALVLVGAVAALVGGRSWEASGRRFRAAGSAVGAGWAAPGSAGPEAAGRGSAGSAAGPGSVNDAVARRDHNLDAWDALSRGEDPTASRSDPTASRSDPSDPAHPPNRPVAGRS